LYLRDAIVTDSLRYNELRCKNCVRYR